MDERDLEHASDEDKSKIFDPTGNGSSGWESHWRWLAENGNVPADMTRDEFRVMVADWQEFLELEAIWGDGR